MDVSTGVIQYKVEGFSPARTLTVEWKNLHHYDGSAPNSQHATTHNLQVVFYETESLIEFHYDSLMTSEQFDSATVGLIEPDAGSSSSVSVRTEDCTPNCKEGGPGSAPGHWGRLAINVDGSAASYFQCIRHTPSPHRYQVAEEDILGGYGEVSGGTAVPFSTTDFATGFATAQVSFPTGFTFPFFGRVYSSVWISTNGLVSFGQSGVSASVAVSTMPTSDPIELANYIAGWHGRLIAPSASDVTTFSASSTEFVIQYADWRSYDASKSGYAGDAAHQMQIHLFSSDATTPGKIEVHYGALSGWDSTVRDQTTVGIQDTFAQINAFNGTVGDFVSGLGCNATELVSTHCSESNWPAGKKLIYTPHVPSWSEVYTSYLAASTPGHCPSCHTDMGTTATAMYSSLITGFTFPASWCGLDWRGPSPDMYAYFCMIRLQADGHPSPLSVLAEQNHTSPLSWLNTTTIGSGTGDALMPFDTYVDSRNCGTGTYVVTTATRNEAAKRDLLSWFASIQPTTLSGTPNSACTFTF